MKYSEYCFFLFSGEFKELVAKALVNMPYLFFTEVTPGSGEYINRVCYFSAGKGHIKCTISGNDNTTNPFRLNVGFIPGGSFIEGFVVALKEFFLAIGIEWTYTDFDDCVRGPNRGSTLETQKIPSPGSDAQSN